MFAARSAVPLIHTAGVSTGGAEYAPRREAIAVNGGSRVRAARAARAAAPPCAAHRGGPRSASATRTTRMSRERSSSSRRFSSHSTRSGERPRHGSVYFTRPSNSHGHGCLLEPGVDHADQSTGGPDLDLQLRSGQARADDAQAAAGLQRRLRAAVRECHRPGRPAGCLASLAARSAALRRSCRGHPPGEQGGVQGDDGVLEWLTPGRSRSACGRASSAGTVRGSLTSSRISGALRDAEVRGRH